MDDGRQVTIAGIGIGCLDRIVIAPRVDWGDSTVVSEYVEQGGGLAATALVACSRLGARCSMYSLLGDDDIAETIVSELVREGIDCGGVVRASGGASPFSFIHVDRDSGERTIFHRPGRGLTASVPDVSGCASADALIVDDIYLDLAVRAARLARSKGIPVVADLIPSEANEELAREVDVLIAPRHFAASMGCEDRPEAALDAIHALGPSTAMVTLGADGWVYSDSSGSGRGEAFRVDAVDTTGAGDVFHGAFTYALAHGWGTARCARFASAVSAIKCTRPGGRTGIPNLSETVSFLKARGAWE